MGHGRWIRTLQQLRSANGMALWPSSLAATALAPLWRSSQVALPESLNVLLLESRQGVC